MKGAISGSSRNTRHLRRFNPRTREGCDIARHEPDGMPGVSIHAPVKGAIPGRDGRGAQGEVSIHAPVKGAMANALASKST